MEKYQKKITHSRNKKTAESREQVETIRAGLRTRAEGNTGGKGRLPDRGQ